MENARLSVECPKKMAVSGFLRKVSSKFWVCVCVYCKLGYCRYISCKCMYWGA